MARKGFGVVDLLSCGSAFYHPHYVPHATVVLLHTLTLGITLYILRITMTTISLKIDDELKAQAEDFASTNGLSLSALIRSNLKKIVAEQKLVLDVPVKKMSPKLEKELMKIEEEVARGEVEGPFDSVDDMIRVLHSRPNGG